MSDSLVGIAVRPLVAADLAFLSRIAPRLHPGATVSPRDPAALDRFFATLANGDFAMDPGAEAFVATLGGQPAGVIVVHPDSDYFTGHPRAHVDHLVVAPEAEGKGTGRALLAHAEQWALARGCREVVLDVFASNSGAIAFYERCGYLPDHVRMAKSVG